MFANGWLLLVGVAELVPPRRQLWRSSGIRAGWRSQPRDEPDQAPPASCGERRQRAAFVSPTAGLTKALKALVAKVKKQEERLQAIENQGRVTTAGLVWSPHERPELLRHAAPAEPRGPARIPKTHLNAIDAKFRLCDGILGEMQQLASGSPDAATSPGIPSPLFFIKIS